MLDRQKIIKYLNAHLNKPLLSRSEEGVFLPAICYVQLENYKEAKDLFGKSITAMFNPPMFWKGSGQPHWLVSVCVLAGRADLYADVRQELDAYGIAKSENLYFHFSDAVMELLLPSSEGIEQQIQRLLGRPKAKDLYAAGLALQAILDSDQANFNKALEELLKVHEGQAKHGGLRWTAEGLLCLPAMALAYVATRHEMKIEVKSDYLSIGYLEYLSK